MKLNSPFRDKLDESFLIFSANILADTNKGLSGAKIVEYFNGYAIDYGKIFHSRYILLMHQINEQRLLKTLDVLILKNSSEL